MLWRHLLALSTFINVTQANQNALFYNYVYKPLVGADHFVWKKRVSCIHFLPPHYIK